MLDLTRYAVVVEVEINGQEELPDEDKRYVSVAFREGFPSAKAARIFAEDVAVAEMDRRTDPGRKVKALVYTLKPVECDCFYADEVVKLGDIA